MQFSPFSLSTAIVSLSFTPRDGIGPHGWERRSLRHGSSEGCAGRISGGGCDGRFHPKAAKRHFNLQMQTKLWQRPNVCNKVYNGAVQELLGGWVARVGGFGWLRVPITFCDSFYGFVLGNVCVCGFLAYLHVKVVESAAVFGCCARISRLSDNFHFFPYLLPIPECQLQTFKVFLAFSSGPTNDKLCQWVCARLSSYIWSLACGFCI